MPTVETSPAPQVDPEERADLLMRHLGAGREGLAAREAERRLAQFGPNVIERREAASAWRELAAQFTHPWRSCCGRPVRWPS